MYAFLTFIPNFFLLGCKSAGKISTENWRERFIRDFFLDDCTIYTLFGSKPLSSKEIINASESEWIEASTPYLQDVSLQEKEFFLSRIKDHCENYYLNKDWEKWINYIENYPDIPFLFARRKTEVEQIDLGYIVNVQEMVWTLQRHYDLFSKQLGYEFDPIEKTFDFVNSDSDFWKQVLSNHMLTGIVYGYGHKNSYLFSREMDTKLQKHSVFASLIRKQSVADEKSIKIPAFKSYDTSLLGDPVIKQYEIERKRIQSSVLERDFVEIVQKQVWGKKNG